MGGFTQESTSKQKKIPEKPCHETCRKLVFLTPHMHETPYFKAFRDVLTLKKYALGQCPSVTKRLIRAPRPGSNLKRCKFQFHGELYRSSGLELEVGQGFLAMAVLIDCLIE